MYFKIIGIIICIFLASLLFQSGRIFWAKTWINHLKGPISKISQLLFEHQYKNVKVEESFSTVKQIELFLFKEFSYESDPLWGIIDIINSPQKSYATKKLDCDDYATLTMWLLEGLKIKANMLTVVTEDIKSSHSICFFVFKTDTDAKLKFAVFDNGILFEVNSFKDLLYVAAEGQGILCWNIMDKNLKIIKKGEGYKE